MRIQRVISILVLTLFTLNLYSQDKMDSCFYVTGENDTIRGTGFMDKNQVSFSFRAFQSNQLHVFTPEDIREIKFSDGRYFLSQTIINTKLIGGFFGKVDVYESKFNCFLEYLFDGEVDILRLYDRGFNRYFIVKEGLPMKELVYEEKYYRKEGKTHSYIDHKFKGYLRIYMSDSPETWELIDNLRTFNEKILLDLVESYHRNIAYDGELTRYYH